MDVMQEGRGVKGGRGSKCPGAPGAQRKGHGTVTWGMRSAGDPELERNCKCRTFNLHCKSSLCAPSEVSPAAFYAEFSLPGAVGHPRGDRPTSAALEGWGEGVTAGRAP